MIRPQRHCTPYTYIGYETLHRNSVAVLAFASISEIYSDRARHLWTTTPSISPYRLRHASQCGFKSGSIAATFALAFSRLVIGNGNDTAQTPHRSSVSSHIRSKTPLAETSHTKPARLLSGAITNASPSVVGSVSKSVIAPRVNPSTTTSLRTRKPWYTGASGGLAIKPGRESDALPAVESTASGRPLKRSSFSPDTPPS